MSALVAAMMRTSTSILSELPTRSMVPYSTTRNIFSCTSNGMVPTSSKKRVPPSAVSKRPRRRCSAPVKAPFSYPNNSLSMSEGLRAAQLSATRGPCQRLERKWSLEAASSFPVPLSPTSSKGLSTSATRESCSWNSRNASDSPKASIIPT